MSQANVNQDKLSTESSEVESLGNGDLPQATSSKNAQNLLELSELIDLGNNLLEQEKFTPALDCYEQVVKKTNAIIAPIYHKLGDIHTKLGQTDEAIASYHYAIDFKHDFLAWSHSNLADALSKKQQWEEAITHYQYAIELGINSFWTYHNLGEAFAQIHQWDDAIDVYNCAIKINADSPWSHHNLGKALSEKQEWEAAIIHYRRAVELDQTSYLFNHSLALAYSQQQYLDEAVVAYGRAVEINSHAYEDYHNLVKILIQKGNLTNAISTYRQALTINPDWAKVEKWDFLDDLASLNSRVITADQLGIISTTTVTKESATQITSESSNKGFVFYGPYINLVDGFYWVKVDFSFPVNETHHEISTDNQLGFKFDIVTDLGKHIWYKTDVSINQENLELFVELNGVHGTEFEFRFDAVGVAFTVKQIRLTLLNESRGNLTNAYYLDLGEILQNRKNFSGAMIAYSSAIERGLNTNSNKIIECYQLFLQNESYLAESHAKLGLLMVKQFGLEAVLNCYHEALHNQTEYAGAYYQLGILLAEEKMMDAALVCFEKAPNKQLREGYVYERIWQGLNGLGPLVDETNSIIDPQKISRDAAYEYFTQNSKYTFLDLHNLTESDINLLETLGLSLANLKLINEDNIFLEEIYINSFGCETRHELAKKSQRKTNFSTTWIALNKTTEFQKSLVETGYIYSLCPVTGRIVRSNQSIIPMPCRFGLSHLAYRFVGDVVFYIVVAGWDAHKIAVYIPQNELIVNLSQIWVGNEREIAYKELINGLKNTTVELPKIINYISDKYPKNIVSINGTYPNLGHYFWNDLSGLLYLHDNEILDKVTHFFVENSYLNSNISDMFPEISPDRITILNDSQRNEVMRRIIDDNCVAVRVTNTVITEELVNRISKTARKLCTSDFLDEVENARQHFPLIWINLRSHNKGWINQIEGYACLIKEIYKDYPNMAVLFDGLPQEQDLMDKIINLIPASVKVYNGLHCSIHETIIWAFAIDTYIAVVGSGLTLVTWIANKPGVAHSERAHLQQQFWWIQVRENMVLPTFISSEHIKDVVGADGKTFYCNYDCDWQIIYQEVVKIVALLKSSKLLKTPQKENQSL